MTFTVVKGTKYVARIELGFFEKVASNSAIEEKLREAGFIEVRVTGSGSVRHAEGRWFGDTVTRELPKQIKAVQAIP